MPTTRTGRIVYRRRPHLFHYRDVLRIVRQVEPARLFASGSRTLLSDVPFVMSTILEAEADLFAALTVEGLPRIPTMDLLQFLLKAIAKLVAIAGEFDLEGAVLQLLAPPPPPVRPEEVSQSTGTAVQ